MPIEQAFNGYPVSPLQPWLTRYINNVENLEIQMQVRWKDAGSVSSSGAVCYNGIGIAPATTLYAGGPAVTDGFGAAGVWQLRTQSCFSSKTNTFIGYNNFFPYLSGCVLDTGVEYTSIITISVSADLGGNFYDVEIRVQIPDASIDETRTISNMEFTNGHCQLRIGGMQIGNEPESYPDNYMIIEALTITEA